MAYYDGLEYNHAQHNQNYANYNTSQQYGPPPAFDPYRQSHTGSSPAFSSLTPASDGKMPFDGPPSAVTEKPPGDHVNLKFKRKKLWWILGALAALLVLGLSLGLGLGLGLGQSSDGSSRWVSNKGF